MLCRKAHSLCSEFLIPLPSNGSHAHHISAKPPVTKLSRASSHTTHPSHQPQNSAKPLVTKQQPSHRSQNFSQATGHRTIPWIFPTLKKTICSNHVRQCRPTPTATSPPYIELSTAKQRATTPDLKRLLHFDSKSCF